MDLTIGDTESMKVFKALASQTRVDILELLLERPMTSSEISERIGYSKAIVSRYMKTLEDARLVKHSKDLDAEDGDGRMKHYSLSVDHVDINFPKRLFVPYHKDVHEVRLGYFSDFSVHPTCGLAGPTAFIADLDDPKSFASNDRVDATLLWFSHGYVEYIIPNATTNHIIPELLEISLEISSEFPQSNNVWPSDISFFINDVKLGTLTIPGNFSDTRGKLTPDWWPDELSQYGLLETLLITHKNTGVNGKKLSDVTLDDVRLSDTPFVKFKIAVEEDAENRGGLTIFGADFGNHQQNILYTMYYTEDSNHEIKESTSREPSRQPDR